MIHRVWLQHVSNQSCSGYDYLEPIDKMCPTNHVVGTTIWRQQTRSVQPIMWWVRLSGGNRQHMSNQSYGGQEYLETFDQLHMENVRLAGMGNLSCIIFQQTFTLYLFKTKSIMHKSFSKQSDNIYTVKQGYTELLQNPSVPLLRKSLGKFFSHWLIFRGNPLQIRNNHISRLRYSIPNKEH